MASSRAGIASAVSFGASFSAGAASGGAGAGSATSGCGSGCASGSGGGCAGCSAGSAAVGCWAPGGVVAGVGCSMLSFSVAPSTISTAMASAAPSGEPSVRWRAVPIPTMATACTRTAAASPNQNTRSRCWRSPARCSLVADALSAASRISSACISPARPELLPRAATCDGVAATAAVVHAI
ncbi:MAG: hypothetical protein F9K20_06945 [Hyphomicrobium sp.]|nr:MAG: hypothetical protein F9K20_06945 [Hyphomicrobium sp.]